jgi:S-methylmethionine-dependent homocysteine/selenocysteine methylase
MMKQRHLIRASSSLGRGCSLSLTLDEARSVSSSSFRFDQKQVIDSSHSIICIVWSSSINNMLHRTRLNAIAKIERNTNIMFIAYPEDETFTFVTLSYVIP